MSRRLRPLLVAAVAVLALAGCQTDPGTAAYLGTQQVTAAQLDRAVVSGEPAMRAQSRQNALNVLVLTGVVRRITDRLGVTVSPAAVAAAGEKEVVRQQAAQTGVKLELFALFDAYRDAMVKHVTAQVVGGVPGLTRDQQQALVQRRVAELGAEAAKDVRVNPRYGAFDVETLQIGPVVEPGITPAPRSGDTAGAGQAPTGG